MGLWVWSSLPTNTQETIHSQAGSSTVLSIALRMLWVLFVNTIPSQ